jgi:hypothetical protein
MTATFSYQPESAQERLAQGHIPCIYWDSGIFIDLMKKNVLPAVQELFDLAGWWQVRIVTSTLTLVELLKQDQSAARYIDAFLDHLFATSTHIKLVSINDPEDPLFFIKLARAIRIAHSTAIDGRPSKKTVGGLDSLHLATAIGCNVPMFHTFDGGHKSRDIGLLDLDKKARFGTVEVPLRIQRPSLVQGDNVTNLYHSIGCSLYSRAYKSLRNNKPIDPQEFLVAHPTFLASDEAEACGYFACAECTEQ